MADDDKPAGSNRSPHAGAAHSLFAPLPVEEATRREMERRRREAQLPANIEWEQLRRQREEGRPRNGRRDGDLIGPPNPYRPHRTR